MVNHKYRRAALGITTALVMTATAFPAAAAPVYVETGEATSASSSDATLGSGLDLEARIIKVAEQDQRSPYAKKGIAVTDDDFLTIRLEPSDEADEVGKLYAGSGCELQEIKGEWAHIVSGECDGYVKRECLLTGAEAEAYAAENNISELVAKSQMEQNTYMYEEPSADSKIVGTVVWDQEIKVLGGCEDSQWVEVEINDKQGYIPSDSVILDVRYEEAVSLEEERAAEEAARKAAEEKAAKEAAEKAAKEAEEKAAQEAAAQEAEAAETEAAETESAESEAAETEAAETEAAETEAPAAETEAPSVSIEDVNEKVWATYSVSIRDGYSTDADKLSVLYGGEGITRTGICDNGWSRVDYNGSSAYIKSEYLTSVEPAVPAVEEAEETTEVVYATAGVNVRVAASTSSDIKGVLVIGASVTRTAESDGWSRVEYNGETCYVKSDYLSSEKPVVETPQQVQTEQPAQKPSGPAVTDVDETVYATDGVNIRKSYTTSSDKIGSLAAGSSIRRTGKLDNGWSRVEWSGNVGYINSDYLTTEKPAVAAAPTTTATSTSSNSSLGQQIVDYACQWVGYPYVYGGNNLSTGVDCSGFTQQVYLHFGYSIPRRASIQATVGTSVSISDLQPGDLVFYGDSTGVGHVTIYIGNEQVVHASTPEKGIIITTMWYRTPMCAKRII